MKSFTIELFLESEMIQTAIASSLGVHQSLDYIRGSSLLGAAAACCYDKLGDHAFDAFHSAKVRFGDARLAPEGVPATAIPMGWLRPKLRAFHKDDMLNSNSIYSISHLDKGVAHKLQLQPIRGGYMSRSGDLFQVETTYRLKTAIDRSRRGAAKESSLFGYEALQAGTTWQASIDIDDDVDDKVVVALRKVFDKQTLWLGRSRGAEYGRTRACIVPTPSENAPTGQARKIAIVCLSDLALTNTSTGLPSYRATPEHFGLPSDWALLPEASSVATRRYSPFNGKRMHRDLERIVIARGSVLTFSGSGQVSLAELHSRSRAGMGSCRQEGLGHVDIAPWYMNSGHPGFGASSKSPNPAPTPKPSSPMAAWMQQRADDRARDDQAAERALQGAKAIHQVQRALLKNKRPVPSTTQWNQLAGIARSHLYRSKASLQDLRNDLAVQMFATAEGARGVGSNAWRGTKGDKPLHKLTLERSLDQFDDARTAMLCLYHLARAVPRQGAGEPKVSEQAGVGLAQRTQSTANHPGEKEKAL